LNAQDSLVSTQIVERMWRTLKSIRPENSSGETRFSYPSEFVLIKEVDGTG
jgi:hypothetical protein